jgi:hypothetical protein
MMQLRKESRGGRNSNEEEKYLQPEKYRQAMKKEISIKSTSAKKNGSGIQKIRR